MDGRSRRLLECKNKYTGAEFHNSDYGMYTVVEYRSNKDVDIVFRNTGGILNTSMDNIKRGIVRDGMAPTVLGVGVTGCVQVRVGSKYDPAYSCWKGMLVRCYSQEYLERFPTYLDCSVSEFFKFYPNFNKWYYEQTSGLPSGWELDKDILVKGNKIYSAETCCFVPPEINTLFSIRTLHRGSYPIGVSYKKSSGKYSSTISENGKLIHLGYFETPVSAYEAYKFRKESYIKALAEKWRSDLRDDVYNALVNWEIDIDD